MLSRVILITTAMLLSPASGQWVHFQDRTADRLVLAGGVDDREKDNAVGDFDRDGWQDIVVVRKAPFKNPGGATDLLLMNREGVLTDETATYAPGFLTTLSDARDVFVTDIDLDGWPDLILANTFEQQPLCYRNRGNDPVSGAWQGFADESAQRLPYLDIPILQFCALCAADITGDGAPEIYFSNYARAPDVALDILLENDGTGHFTDVSEARLGELRRFAFGTSVDLRDIDGDDDLDICKTSSLSSVAPWNEVGVFVIFNDGSGNFDSFQPVPTESPYMFAIDDLNDDGRLDFYIVNDSQDFTVLNAGVDLSRPDPLLFDKTILQDSPRTYFLGGNLQCADLDNDGDLDVAVADVDVDIGICTTTPGDPRSFALLRNEGQASGTLADPFGLETNPWNINAFDFAIFDIDRDGKLDLFLCGCTGYAVMMQEHTLHLSSTRLDFDGVIAGSTLQQVLRVCNNGGEPVAVGPLRVSGGPGFSISESAFTLQPYECRDLLVTYAPAAPGTAAADLLISAGSLSRQVSLEGRAVTSPVASLDGSPIELALSAEQSAGHSLQLTNLGGSDLQIEIGLQIPGLDIDRLLLLGDPLAVDLCEIALQALPNEYTTMSLDDLAEDSFDGFDIVVLALTSGPVSAENMADLAQAAADGKSLIIVGATTDPDFLDGLGAGLLEYQNLLGWQQPADPHFVVTDSNHPLADGLPASHQFLSTSASWFRLLPDDPAAWVAAENGDGFPCLLSKRLGAGSLVYFSNWPLSFAWDNDTDRPIIETIMRNAIGHSRAGWLSVDPRRFSLSPGEGIPIELAFNATGLSPGDFAANLVITTSDPLRPQIVIPTTLTVTAAESGVTLVVESVSATAATVQLRGEPGASYLIQRSVDLHGWQTITTAVASGGGVAIELPLPAGSGRVYFRAARED